MWKNNDEIVNINDKIDIKNVYKIMKQYQIKEIN